MNRDDIIRMAREIGLEHREAAEELNSPYCDGIYLDDLERFAALVAAAEREACAKVCDDKAKETFSGQCQVWGDYFARVIRARGEK